MQTWKCSQDKHSLEESGSWGKSLFIEWWKEFMKEEFQEKKKKPCQEEQEWARYFEIITITQSNGIIIQTNINWYSSSR